MTVLSAGQFPGAEHQPLAYPCRPLLQVAVGRYLHRFRRRLDVHLAQNPEQYLNPCPGKLIE